MNSARFEIPRIEQLEKIKYLADEMAKRKVQFGQIEELRDEEVFHKIMFAKSTKHKSQIFVNRNKKKLLNYFALNRGSSEDLVKIKNNINKKDKGSKRRQSTMLTKNKNYHRNNNINKVYTHQLNIGRKINKNKIIKSYKEEDNNEDRNSGSNDTINDYDDIEDEDEDEDEEEEENEEENDKVNNEENKNYNENDDSNNTIKLDQQKYEIRYVNPREIKIIYDKENSPIYNRINNTLVIPNKNKDKGRYLYDKEMKLLKIRNNKIEKKRQNLENKNKDFFQVSYYLNLNSMKKVVNNPDYQPIQSKAIEEYQHHLAKIEIKQNKEKLKQLNEEKKELDEIINHNKLKKRNFSQSSWEEFVEKEYYWIEEKRKATELKRYIIKNQIKYKPKINKKSVIIYKKLNKKNKNNNNYSNDNIFNRLYNAQEKYDKNLKIKREQSMPTFTPIINKSKRQNKIIFKGLNNLNNIDYTNKDNISSIKTVKNNENSKINPLILEYQNKNSIKNPNNNKQFSLKNNKKPQFSGISIKNNQKISPLTMKNKNKNKKINKNINLGYNISDNKIINSNKNKKKSEIINKQNEKKMYSPYSKKIDENKKENNSSEKKENKNNINKSIKGNDTINNINKNNNKNINNERYEELYKAIKNISYNKNNKSNNDKNKLLYNLNIRDNTSNTIRQNIVLISNKYKDFFYLDK